MDFLHIFLKKHYTEDEPIILACSSGPDSMYLLYKILKTKYAKKLIVCYFNHKLRKESDAEELFLEKLSKKHNFTLEVAEANMKSLHENFYKTISLEELCRKKRYEFFNAILHIYKTNKILLAHHLDDKIETFFFNLARGSKISGLINMQEQSGNILRPLLHIEKTEILNYLEENKLDYKIDHTNLENNFTRNKIRNQILPLFEAIHPKYKHNVSHFVQYLGEVKEMIDQEVEKFLQQFEAHTFSIPVFNTLSPFLQKEVIRYMFFISNGNSTIGLSSANIQEIIKFINGKNNKTVKEIKNLKMKKDGKVILY